jgi:hypothetical protein
MRKVADNYTAEIIILIVIATMLLTSCSFNHRAEAMPPIHELYYELSVQEKQVYNSLSAEERANVNKNTQMHQLKNALGDEFTN